METVIQQDPEYAHILRVSIQGRIDTNNADKLEEKILAALHDKKAVVVDMADVSYLSSSAIRVLYSMHRRLEEKGGRLMLIGVSNASMKVLKAVQLHDLLHVYPTLDEAMKEA